MNLIIGDSHILALQKYQSSVNHLHQFSAASIRGLLNINSISNTRNNILEICKKNTYNKLFIMFGKVDLEWVFSYKKKQLEININNFIVETVEKYIIFIKEISQYFNEIYIMGLHPPSLESDDMLRCINSESAIKDVSTKACIQSDMSVIYKLDSLLDRTNYIIQFNEIIKQKLYEMDVKYKYIDIMDELIDNNTNICKEYFIDKGDHHLNRDKTGIIWFEKHLHKLF